MSIFEKFNDQGLGKRSAFEKLCCQLFESWGKYEENLKDPWVYRAINGTGGDGGIEAYWHNTKTDEWIGIQAKWFPIQLAKAQLAQIYGSIDTALHIRPTIQRYIVCIPQDLTSAKNAKEGKTSIGKDKVWSDFKNKIKGAHPSVNLILWDESTILKLLNRHESEGCWRFWFGKSEINPENITLSLNEVTARIGARYTPEIAVDGGMSTFLDSFFGTPASRKSLLVDINSPIAKTEHVMGLIDSFLQLDEQTTSGYKDLAAACRSALEGYAAALQNLRAIVVTESGTAPQPSLPDIDYHSIEKFHQEIYHLQRSSHLNEHARELNEALDSFKETPGLWELSKAASNATSQTHCVIAGDQGTGKTCGIVNKAQKYMKAKHHVPILLLATDFHDGDSWFQAVKRALGLGDNWDEAALWQALTSYAALNDYAEGDLYIRSKVAIMVDGLDEASSPSGWEERIREGDTISTTYPRIRFAYTSRPWAARFKDKSLLRCRYQIDGAGDVPAWKLFDRYIEHYNVDLDGNDSYKWLLNTPSELYMFCAAYRNQRLSEPVSTCLIELTNAEIDRLEDEYAGRCGNTASLCCSKPVRQALDTLSSLFLTTKGNADQAAVQKTLGADGIPDEHSKQLIAFLVQYGILYRTEVAGKSPFAPPINHYSPGSRHLWDYSMAYQLVHGKSQVLGELISDNENIANMYGVLLAESGTLPINSKELVGAVGDQSAREITLYALANIDPNAADAFRPWALAELKHGGDARSDIVNEVVLPVANIQGHPLGSTMLDEFLRTFPNPIARDIAWSFPDTTRNSVPSGDPRYAFHLERQALESMPRLHSQEAAEQMPLVLAWGLSALSNLRRRHCRSELVTWGLKNPQEFTKLFEHFCRCDDPQIREDMFAIAEEIVCQGKADDATKTALKELVLTSVFSQPNSPHNRDAATRFYGRLLVEDCYRNRLADDAAFNLSKPPYATDEKNAPLPIFPDAAKAKSMRGYGPIHYDLARYVLVDRLSNLFAISHYPPVKSEENTTLDSIIAASANKAGIADAPDFQGWVIAAAYQYLLDHGYDPEILEGPIKKSGYRSGGLDSTIARTFHHADHGSRSTVMTVAEKYVWCARNEICGYLSDRLKVKDDYWTDDVLVNEGAAADYGMLLSLDSPLLEATVTKHQKLHHSFIPAFPEAFSCSGVEPCSKLELEMWIDAIALDNATSLIDYQPNAATSINGETIPLALYACDWGPCGKSTSAWISCGTITPEELSELDEASTICLDGYRAPSDLSVSYKSVGAPTYISPVEALSTQCITEYDEPYSPKSIAATYIKPKPLTGKDVASLTDIGDFWYHFPSELARKLCGVVQTNGVEYFNDEGVTAFEDLRFGTEYRHRYNALLADKNTLLSALEESGLRLIWYATIQRRSNNLARERIPGNDTWKEESWLIWVGDDGEYRSAAIAEEDEPDHQPNNGKPDNVIASMLNSIDAKIDNERHAHVIGH